MTSSMTLIESVAVDVGYQANTSKQSLMTRYGIKLLSGNRPTKAQLQACVYQYSLNDRVYDSAPLATLVTTLGGKVVISMLNTSVVLPVTWKHDKIAMSFTELADQSASLQDDAPTWGLIYLFPKGYPSNLDQWVSRVLLYFTVGDQNSNADMKIQGGFIPKGTMWRINDVEIAITGGVK